MKLDDVTTYTCAPGMRTDDGGTTKTIICVVDEQWSETQITCGRKCVIVEDNIIWLRVIKWGFCINNLAGLWLNRSIDNSLHFMSWGKSIIGQPFTGILVILLRLCYSIIFCFVNAHLPGCFCPWTFRLNIGLNTSPSDSFVSYLNSHLGYSAGEFQALQLIVLAVFGAVD